MNHEIEEEPSPPTMDPTLIGISIWALSITLLLGISIRATKRNWQLSRTVKLLNTKQNKTTLKNDPDLLQRADALLRK